MSLGKIEWTPDALLKELFKDNLLIRLINRFGACFGKDDVRWRLKIFLLSLFIMYILICRLCVRCGQSKEKAGFKFMGRYME